MEVEGAIYPPSALNQWMSQACIYLLFFLIAMTLIGDNLFKSLDFPLGTRICTFFKQNFSATMILAFVLNTAAQQLVATGAFEIEINKEIVFSKLQSGKLPTLDLLETLAKQYAVAETSM
mmetsp:Transcript_8273/g.15347  ORF Transcript_8273/g.15347 Transcript_8273/m.15347 type:complete len:120 (-) Transcript_8273:378-737(-)